MMRHTPIVFAVLLCVASVVLLYAGANVDVHPIVTSDCTAAGLQTACVTGVAGRICIDSDNGQVYRCGDNDGDGTFQFEQDDITPTNAISRIYDEGTIESQRSAVDFIGTEISCDNDGVNSDQIDCTITAAPNDAALLAVSSVLEMATERTLAVGTGLDTLDGGGNSTLTVSHDFAEFTLYGGSADDAEEILIRETGTSTTDPVRLAWANHVTTTALNADAVTGAKLAHSLTLDVDYYTWDSNGDGTLDASLCGDKDADGTLEGINDIQDCVNDLLDPDADGTQENTRTVSYDHDNDGTNEYTDTRYDKRTAFLVPGQTYTVGAASLSLNWDGFTLDCQGATIRSTFVADTAAGCLSGSGGSSANKSILLSVGQGNDDFARDVHIKDCVLEGIGSPEPLMEAQGSSDIADPDGDSTADGDCQKNLTVVNPWNVTLENIISKDSWRTNTFIQSAQTDTDADGTVGYAKHITIHNMQISGDNGHNCLEIEGGGVVSDSWFEGCHNERGGSAAIRGTLSAMADGLTIAGNRIENTWIPVALSVEEETDLNGDGTFNHAAQTFEQLIVTQNSIRNYDTLGIQIKTVADGTDHETDSTVNGLSDVQITFNTLDTCGKGDGSTSAIKLEDGGGALANGIVSYNIIEDCDVTTMVDGDGDGTIEQDIRAITVVADGAETSHNKVYLTGDGTVQSGTIEDSCFQFAGSGVDDNFIFDNLCVIQNTDDVRGMNIQGGDRHRIMDNVFRMTVACASDCNGILLNGSTNYIRIEGNDYYGVLTDTQSALLRSSSGTTHTMGRFNRNFGLDISTMASLNLATHTDWWADGNICDECSGFMFNTDAAAMPFMGDNFCDDCDVATGGFNSANTHGWYVEYDETEDGVRDAATAFRVREDTRLELSTEQCGAVSVDPPNILATSTGSATATATGVKSGERCACTVATDWDDDLIMKDCRASAANTIQVRWYNPTGGAIDAAAQSMNYCCIGQ